MRDPLYAKKDAKMLKNHKIYLVVLLISTAAFSGYEFGKYKKQQELDFQFQSIFFDTISSEFRAYASIFEMMKEKDYQKAENLLEGYLDVTLSSLGAYDSVANENLDQKTIESIKKLKNLREKFKTHQVHPKLEKGVERAFNLVE